MNDVFDEASYAQPEKKLAAREGRGVDIVIQRWYAGGARKNSGEMSRKMGRKGLKGRLVESS